MRGRGRDRDVRRQRAVMGERRNPGEDEPRRDLERRAASGEQEALDEVRAREFRETPGGWITGTRVALDGYDLLTERGMRWTAGTRDGTVVSVKKGRFYGMYEPVAWLEVRLDRPHGRYSFARICFDQATGRLMHGARWLPGPRIAPRGHVHQPHGVVRRGGVSCSECGADGPNWSWSPCWGCGSQGYLCPVHGWTWRGGAEDTPHYVRNPSDEDLRAAWRLLHAEGEPGLRGWAQAALASGLPPEEVVARVAAMVWDRERLAPVVSVRAVLEALVEAGVQPDEALGATVRGELRGSDRRATRGAVAYDAFRAYLRLGGDPGAGVEALWREYDDGSRDARRRESAFVDMLAEVSADEDWDHGREEVFVYLRRAVFRGRRRWLPAFFGSTSPALWDRIAEHLTIGAGGHPTKAEAVEFMRRFREAGRRAGGVVYAIPHEPPFLAGPNIRSRRQFRR